MGYPNFLNNNDLIGVPASSEGAYDDLKINKL